MTVVRTLAQADAEIGRLQGVIASAMAAMDRGEYGAARTILRTGKDEPLKAVTAVVARDGGAA